MKEIFVSKKFSASSTEIITRAQQVLDSYAAQGYDLSLRQLYYQFVSRNWLANTEQNYKRLGSIINDARLAGKIDWNMIKDRGRTTLQNSHWNSPRDILKSAAQSFQINKWEDQPCHVEVMVEKQALEGVLVPVCRELDVPFTANKGYTSASAMYETSKRMLRASQAGKKIYVMYLGDHDPSGIDMSRDVDDRLALFLGVTWHDSGANKIYVDPKMMGSLDVQRLALNMDQVERYNPPENPTKLTDSRADGYIAEFGMSCWELDALQPEVLAGLVRSAVLSVRDDDLWDGAVDRQSKMVTSLERMAREYND